MSFDLSFRKRTNRQVIVDAKQFKAFLDTRNNYTETDDRFYDYDNEETNTPFSLIFARIDDGTINRPDLNPHEDLVDFNMGYGGDPGNLDEICSELDALCKYFDLEMCDPQREGDGHYKPFNASELKASLAESYGFAASVVNHLAAQGEHVLIPSAPKKKGWWPF